jgi:hypothetical protein
MTATDENIKTAARGYVSDARTRASSSENAQEATALPTPVETEAL